MSLRKSSPKGNLHKIECPDCDNHYRKTEAQLRDKGPDLCGFCYDLTGQVVRMRCSDEAVAAITPDGRARALEEALAVEGRRLEREHKRAAAAAYPQLCCDRCARPLTKASSVELIEEWQRQNRSGYDYGIVALTVEDEAMPEAGFIHCKRCGHDHFRPVVKSGRRKREEKREEEAWAF